MCLSGESINDFQFLLFKNNDYPSVLKDAHIFNTYELLLLYEA